jgi:hypothetical protein
MDTFFRYEGADVKNRERNNVGDFGHIDFQSNFSDRFVQTEPHTGPNYA